MHTVTPSRPRHVLYYLLSTTFLILSCAFLPGVNGLATLYRIRIPGYIPPRASEAFKFQNNEKLSWFGRTNETQNSIFTVNVNSPSAISHTPIPFEQDVIFSTFDASEQYIHIALQQEAGQISFVKLFVNSWQQDTTPSETVNPYSPRLFAVTKNRTKLYTFEDSPEHHAQATAVTYNLLDDSISRTPLNYKPILATIDNTNAHLYTVNQEHSLVRVNLNTMQPEEAAVVGVTAPKAIALDNKNEFLYLLDYEAGSRQTARIFKVNTTSMQVDTISGHFAAYEHFEKPLLVVSADDAFVFTQIAQPAPGLARFYTGDLTQIDHVPDASFALQVTEDGIYGLDSDFLTFYDYGCNNGTYVNGSFIGGCAPCEPGSFSITINTEVCSSCPAGTFQDEYGQASCKLCPVGTYNRLRGAISCVPCDTATETGMNQCPPTLIQTIFGWITAGFVTLFVLVLILLMNMNFKTTFAKIKQCCIRSQTRENRERL